MAIEKRAFGRTGHMSSVVIFGGAALWSVDDETSERVLEQLLEYGINHIDVAPRYGEAETRVGTWMDRHRGDFFLASKTAARDYLGAKTEFYRSLDRLRTDHLDLIQLHALYHPDECDQALSEGGALEALVEAREQGLVRFIGVTGHSWTVAAMHRRNLERFDFDSVLMPWNWIASKHPTYAGDFETTRGICAERDIAVQVIKAVARGPWAAGAERNRSVWYQPLEDETDIRMAVHWVLARGDVFMVSPGDVGILPLVLQSASEPVTALGNATMEALEERTGLTSIFGL